jgi:peptidyl-prolyl cis-trans isomerase A (cyclophilin A)
MQTEPISGLAEEPVSITRLMTLKIPLFDQMWTTLCEGLKPRIGEAWIRSSLSLWIPSFKNRGKMMRLMAIALTMIILLFALGIAPAAAQGNAQPNQANLTNPALFNALAPDSFQVKFETSKGDILVEVTRAWAPNGADRFYNLVKNGYYDGCRFFRVVEEFMAQFGINGDPKVNSVWMHAKIKDDPVKQSNTRGFVTFAFVDANSRATQVFINSSDNSYLDELGFSPFGKVTAGLEVVDAIYNKYGETPDQTKIQLEGNAYLEKTFPNLDYIKSATIVTPAKQGEVTIPNS